MIEIENLFLEHFELEQNQSNRDLIKNRLNSVTIKVAIPPKKQGARFAFELEGAGKFASMALELKDNLGGRLTQEDFATFAHFRDDHRRDPCQGYKTSLEILYQAGIKTSENLKLIRNSPNSKAINAAKALAFHSKAKMHPRSLEAVIARIKRTCCNTPPPSETAYQLEALRLMQQYDDFAQIALDSNNCNHLILGLYELHKADLLNNASLRKLIQEKYPSSYRWENPVKFAEEIIQEYKNLQSVITQLELNQTSHTDQIAFLITLKINQIPVERFSETNLEKVMDKYDAYQKALKILVKYTCKEFLFLLAENPRRDPVNAAKVLKEFTSTFGDSDNLRETLKTCTNFSTLNENVEALKAIEALKTYNPRLDASNINDLITQANNSSTLDGQAKAQTGMLRKSTSGLAGTGSPAKQSANCNEIQQRENINPATPTQYIDPLAMLADTASRLSDKTYSLYGNSSSKNQNSPGETTRQVGEKSKRTGAFAAVDVNRPI